MIIGVGICQSYMNVEGIGIPRAFGLWRDPCPNSECRSRRRSGPEGIFVGDTMGALGNCWRTRVASFRVPHVPFLCQCSNRKFLHFSGDGCQGHPTPHLLMEVQVGRRSRRPTAESAGNAMSIVSRLQLATTLPCKSPSHPTLLTLWVCAYFESD